MQTIEIWDVSIIGLLAPPSKLCGLSDIGTSTIGCAKCQAPRLNEQRTLYGIEHNLLVHV